MLQKDATWLSLQKKTYMLILLNDVYLNTVLPVMLSSKLLPEMEMEDNIKREQLLHGMQSLSLATQIEKLKASSYTAHTM